VVVTGLGVATPIGMGIEPFWDGLLSRSCGIKPIAAFDATGLGCRVGGELPEFSLADHIPKTYRKNIKVMARDIAIAVVCAKQAVDDAGLVTKCTIGRGESEGPSNVDSTRFGANIGAGLICADLKELAEALRIAADDRGAFSLKKWGAEGMANLTPLWLLKFLPNMLACHVTIVHDAQAPSNTITCGEASSHMAIGEALRTIARGDADVCICGGAESKINPMAVARPLLWKRVSVDGNDHPESASRPFAADCRGTIPAEGGGLIILESLEHAKRRGARIHAEVAGFGSSCNTMSWTEPDPSGAPLARAIRHALRDAAIDASAVGLLCPLGTGTMAHDASEIAAFNQVFDGRIEEIPALTTRGAVGNSGAGAGAIDFAAAVMARSTPASNTR
jgi:3-oxoacyl-[acyl-carrier-protein] synthase II